MDVTIELLSGAHHYVLRANLHMSKKNEKSRVGKLQMAYVCIYLGYCYFALS